MKVTKTNEIESGQALDNIFVERLWRSVKYEDVYLNGYANRMEPVIGLSEYLSVLQWRKTTPVFRQPNTSRSVSVGKRRRRKDSGQV